MDWFIGNFLAGNGGVLLVFLPILGCWALKNFGGTRVIGEHTRTHTPGLQENSNRKHGHAHTHIGMVSYLFLYVSAIKTYMS